VELVRIPLGAITVELLFPFHQVAFATVFLDLRPSGVRGASRTQGRSFDDEPRGDYEKGDRDHNPEE
jgi:hypothetical protein